MIRRAHEGAELPDALSRALAGLRVAVSEGDVEDVVYQLLSYEAVLEEFAAAGKYDPGWDLEPETCSRVSELLGVDVARVLA